VVKIYGSSDDLVCLDNSNYGVDEIGCFDVKGVRLFLDDDTIIVVRYIDGIWRIEIERKGTAPYQHEVCAGKLVKTTGSMPIVLLAPFWLTMFATAI